MLKNRIIPCLDVKNGRVVKGINFLDLLSSNNIISSKSEARRILKNNGLKINDQIIYNDKKIVNLDDFHNNKFIKISLGKKKHYRFVLI